MKFPKKFRAVVNQWRNFGKKNILEKFLHVFLQAFAEEIFQRNSPKSFWKKNPSEIFIETLEETYREIPGRVARNNPNGMS